MARPREAVSCRTLICRKADSGQLNDLASRSCGPPGWHFTHLGRFPGTKSGAGSTKSSFCLGRACCRCWWDRFRRLGINRLP